MQISCAVTAQRMSDFVFAIRIVQSLYYIIRNFKPLAIFCGCTAWFVSDLVENPEDRFPYNEAHLWLLHLVNFRIGDNQWKKLVLTNHKLPFVTVIQNY